ncbi:MFS transporter [Enterococcus sp. LJL120]
MTLKEKAGFALVNLGNIPVMTLLNTYLLIFYTDVVGISPATVATLFLVSRLMDGLTDPIMGFLIDRFPKTKFGKYRPILILGTIICCINYLLVWFAPLLIPQAKVLVIAVSYLLLGVTFDMMDIPLNSLIPVLAKEDNQRNVLSSIKGVSYTVGPTLLNIIAPLTIAGFASKLQGYIVLITGTVITVLFFTIVGAMSVKEKSDFDSAKDGEKQEGKTKYSFSDMVKIIKIPSVFTLFLSMLLVTAANNIFSGSILYYVTYILGDERVFSLASLIGMLGAVIAGSLVPQLAKKYGKQKVYTIALLMNGLILLAVIVLNHNLLMFYLMYLVVQFGLGLINTIQYSISAENVDLIHQELGIQTAGLIASLNSLIMKFAMAVGGAVPGFILSSFGYVANQNQTARSNLGIVIATFMIPFVLYILTAVVFVVGMRKAKQKTLLVKKEILTN